MTQPELFPIDDAEAEPLYTCPECGDTGDLDHFDGLGADDGCLFCNACGREFKMEEKS